MLIVMLFACVSKTLAQTEHQVTATILHLDSAFWKAYNNCDTANYKDFFTNDVEFYHDKGGITLGAPALIESLKKNLCSDNGYRLRRQAVPGTVRVYPMQKDNKIYGAIISGEHVFYVTSDGKPEYLDGQANFNQLWLLENGEWRMKQILSYNHHVADYINSRKEVLLSDKELDQLTGIYKSEKSGTMNLVREDHVLVLKSGDKSFTLYPQALNSFFTKERDLVFEFVKDTNNKLARMVVKEHGAVADELLFEK